MNRDNPRQTRSTDSLPGDVVMSTNHALTLSDSAHVSTRGLVELVETRIREADRVAHIAHTAGASQLLGDCTLLWSHGVNGLIVGPKDPREQVLRLIAAKLDTPITTLDCEGVLNFEKATTCRTVILAELHRLSPSEQARLQTWLTERDNPPQVLSTSDPILWAHVSGGGFLKALYYRLNTICIEI